MTMTATAHATTPKTGNAPVFYEVEEHAHPEGSSTMLGFWIYLMSDLLIFASLFVTYVVLAGGTNGGPGAKELFDLKFVAGETALLLISSLTFGLGMIAMHHRKVGQMFGWLAVTWLLGAGFMVMEIWEFNHLIHNGHGPDHSAFLSAFFALVGTHGLHVSAGLLWLLVMFVRPFSISLALAALPLIAAYTLSG